jgi:hypothetical protein
MSDSIVYVDTSEIRPGALGDLKVASKELVDFVDSNEPQLIAYGMYLNDDGSGMTVIQIHPDSASLEYHMEVAGPLFRNFVELIRLMSIRIYGTPSERLLKQLHEKARLLGGAIVEVHPLHAGFTRFGAS